MSPNFPYKYAEALLNQFDEFPLALTDSKLKIIWFNRQFKNASGKRIIKDKLLSDLFGDNVIKPSDILTGRTPTDIELEQGENILSVIPLLKGKNTYGYLCKLKPNKPAAQGGKLNSNQDPFQTELQSILQLIVKEKSIGVLIEEVLIRSVNLGKASFGIAALISTGSNEYFYFDPQNLLKNKREAEREIDSNFIFISKWLNVNKRSLIGLDAYENIGFNLAKALKSKFLLITPCHFEDKLLAVILLGRNESKFLQLEIQQIEQFASLLGFAISSTRARELTAALEARLYQSQKLETIGKLSSGMAHDFNNLLSSIFGSLNLLRKRVPEAENVSRLLDNIENCSIRARDLTKGLLSFGKPTAKRKELVKSNLIIEELSKVVNQTFSKKIEFFCSVDEPIFDILGNATEIYQVLLNLCVNAKEAIKGKGTIKLSAKNVTIDEQLLFKHPQLEKGNYVCFSVSDTGTGISEENIQKIFDPYFSTKQKDTGSGLGLYVTFGIVKSHGGTIEVSSKINQGTTFDVYLPAYEPVKTEKQIKSDKIIMLADDEVMLRDLLAELLESNGYEVIKVSSGFEALKVLTEEIKVDLIIMDHNMPEMTGLECIAKIRALKIDVPVILSTGSLQVENKDDLIKNGVTTVLPKPYEFESMLETIQNLIG